MLTPIDKLRIRFYQLFSLARDSEGRNLEIINNRILKVRGEYKSLTGKEIDWWVNMTKVKRYILEAVII